MNYAMFRYDGFFFEKSVDIGSKGCYYNMR